MLKTLLNLFRSKREEKNNTTEPGVVNPTASISIADSVTIVTDKPKKGRPKDGSKTKNKKIKS
jgi:hypothetical protein